MYILENKNQPTPIEETTFADLNMLERDIEEMLRLNIDMLCETDEESMLIVGKQVRNAQNGRSDLTAIDNNGNIVLIEVKYSLQGTTQGRYLTGGVPPVRFSM